MIIYSIWHVVLILIYAFVSSILHKYLGVADQLQTNYASDLRHILKAVFECYTSDVVDRTMVIGTALDNYVHDEADDETEYNGISNSQSTGVEARPRIVGVNSQNSGNSSGEDCDFEL